MPRSDKKKLGTAVLGRVRSLSFAYASSAASVRRRAHRRCPECGNLVVARVPRLAPVARGSLNLELSYFPIDEYFDQGWDNALELFFGGVSIDDRQMLLGKSPGVMFLPKAVDRAFLHNPDMRVIVMLREPVVRAFSAYRYFLARKRETAPPFAAALALEEGRLAADFDGNHHFAYVGRGLYAEQIERLHEVFGEAQVLVVILEEFTRDPVRGLTDVCQFLGLDPWTDEEMKTTIARKYNVTDEVGVPVLGLQRFASRLRRALLPTQERRALRRLLTSQRSTSHVRLDPDVSARLLQRFAEPNEALYRLLGRRVDAWETAEALDDG